MLLFDCAPNCKASVLTALPRFLLWVSGLCSSLADGSSTWWFPAHTLGACAAANRAATRMKTQKRWVVCPSGAGMDLPIASVFQNKRRAWILPTPTAPWESHPPRHLQNWVFMHRCIHTHSSEPNQLHFTKRGLHRKDHFYFSMPLINSACCPVGSNFKIVFTSLKGPPLFLGAPKSLQMVTTDMKLKDAYSLEGKLWPT